jgi:hypothetical protein
MRYALIGVLMTLCTATTALAEVRVNIGINLPAYPRLVAVPGYPVYYAPGVDSNYFFYDGLYWVFDGDEWYASSWYNGPWEIMGPDAVPLYVLQVPVRYYRHAPAYFRSWRRDAAPRWGERWGRDWEHRHNGWNSRERRAYQAPAPLPSYQRQYSGNRYPQSEQQSQLHSNNYRYQPRENVVREHYQQRDVQQREERGRARGDERREERRDDRGQNARGPDRDDRNQGQGRGRDR